MKTMEEEKKTNEEAVDTKNKQRPEKAKGSKKTQIISVLLVLFIIATAALGGLSYVVNRNAKSQQKTDREKLEKLEKEKNALADKLKKATEESSTKSGDTATTPSTSDLENIQAAISSRNYAALEGYMADSVNVIIAASEGIGDRTPTQAVADMVYLNNGTDPWNFSLPAATVTAWACGDYASYISVDGLVGKSANNYVVAFMFDDAGKISDVFMAASADLL